MRLLSAGFVSKWYPKCQISSMISQPIQKVLIANRGEIACRIITAARSMDITSVAVYSDADRNSRHVSMADEAYYIGQSQASQSYLRHDKILKVAKESGCCAIHPGYGFLSENATFSETCKNHDVIFIGPPSASIKSMGVKSESKLIMSNAGVPIIQGYHGEEQSKERLLDEARQIGFPVMLKAVMGGGGKGMRIANSEQEFFDALESARREAMKSFGDDNMLVEKFVQRPRHVEVQVFCDKHGNAVYLYERDCSVQRRHQKIIEEAPAPGISADLRKQLGEAAVAAARAVSYVGAGTVEFILDEAHNFYFMEMNTRLQVEHPITEMVTGVDLVKWQFKIAAGEKLPLHQSEIPLNGHSFEARIYAEDPSANFIPGAGRLDFLRPPSASPNIRIETGVREGDEVSVFYDPMIAKLVVWGPDRVSALRRLTKALEDYHIAGLSTNISFLHRLANFPHFISGDVHTDFIPQHQEELLPTASMPSNELVCYACLAFLLRNSHTPTIWQNSQNFRVNGDFVKTFKFSSPQTTAIVTSLASDKFQVVVGDSSYEVATEMNSANDSYTVTVNGFRRSFTYYFKNNNVYIFSGSEHWKFELPRPAHEDLLSKESSKGSTKAPMTGVIDRILVKEGDSVIKGQQMAVMTAMKMEHVIKSPQDGVIKTIFHRETETVQRNTLLFDFVEE